MGFCYGSSDIMVLPKNSSSASSLSRSPKAFGDGAKKKQPQAVKKEEKEKKRGNLDRSAMAAPHLPFHSRPTFLPCVYRCSLSLHVPPMPPPSQDHRLHSCHCCCLLMIVGRPELLLSSLCWRSSRIRSIVSVGRSNLCPQSSWIHL